MRERLLKTSLVVVSLVLVSAAFVTWPNARSTAGPLARPEPSSTPGAAATTVDAEVGFTVPRRDPFGNPPTEAAASPPSTPLQRVAPKILSALPPVPGIPILPANAGAGIPRVAATDDVATSVSVRAVVTGEHGFALIESGASVRIVARGDRIAGAVVTGVDAAGVLLDSGKHLLLAPLASEDRKVRP